jgi:hypothetical protein
MKMKSENNPIGQALFDKQSVYISNSELKQTGLNIGSEFIMHGHKNADGTDIVFKVIGRPPLPPALKTKPYTVWLTDAERSKVKQQERGWLRKLIRKARP